jgi:GNAT superfamily N-acetyltransferase
VRIASLRREQLAAATTLLAQSLPRDGIAIVAEEKLFGGNGTRSGLTVGAFADDDSLVGVVASAGRWVKLLAVAEPERRRGIGSALLDHVQQAQPEAGLRIGDHPGNYLSPGVDGGYADARAFFDARGFREVGMVENIRAPMDTLPPMSEVAGYTLCRVDATNRALVLDWIGRSFAPVWALEAGRALDGPRHALHVALVDGGDGALVDGGDGALVDGGDGAPVAFAAADGNNQGLGWFGPAGTQAAHRGKRLGEALLLRCLHDVRGLPEAGVIAWIGPKEFYRKTVGAVEDRRFIQLERPKT